MAKFCVGDRVVCVNSDGLQRFWMKDGDDFTVLFCGEGCMQTEQIGITRAEAQFCSSHFELASPKQTLQELYVIENNKLFEQGNKVDALWELIQAESVSLKASRQKAIEDKRLQVDILLDDLESAQDAFDKADGELAEMLRNEPF